MFIGYLYQKTKVKEATHIWTENLVLSLLVTKFEKERMIFIIL